jgi:RNA polymerase sigma-70 factor (ECF subfamily)
MSYAPTTNAAVSTDSAPHACEAVDTFLAAVTDLMPALRAFGCSLCGDPIRADDLVQDTIIRAHTYRRQFQASTNLKA